MKITIKIVREYGNERMYPDCPKSEMFAKLMRRKTFLQADLTLIRGLGFEIVAYKKEAKKIPV
jgi:hypothetical protein